jgi:hypothetical protein
MGRLPSLASAAFVSLIFPALAIAQAATESYSDPAAPGWTMTSSSATVVWSVDAEPVPPGGPAF